MRDLLFTADESAPPLPPLAQPRPFREMLETIELPPADLPALEPDEEARILAEVLEHVSRDAPIGLPIAAAYQDFQLRCRICGVKPAADLAAFRRDFALARAGLGAGRGNGGRDHPRRRFAGGDARALPRPRRRGPSGRPPSIGRKARSGLYGTSSPGRARWMLTAMEEKGLIASRVDLAGRRTISLPHFGWQTAPAAADPSRPGRLARIAGREAARHRG